MVEHDFYLKQNPRNLLDAKAYDQFERTNEIEDDQDQLSYVVSIVEWMLKMELNLKTVMEAAKFAATAVQKFRLTLGY